MTIPAKYMHIKVATQHVYETRCFYGFDDLHYCDILGGPFRQEFSTMGLGVCVLFAAVLSVSLQSSHFVQDLPTQLYYFLNE